MSIPSSSDLPRYRLEWEGSVLELVSRRVGLRTEVVLLRDDHPVGEGTGAGWVLLSMPQPTGAPSGEHEAGAAPSVLALSLLPGTISKAFLLVPKPDAAEQADSMAELPKGVAELAGVARAERNPFEPPAGTLAARMLAFQRAYPRLYAARHVVLAVGKVALGLLGVVLFVQLILRRVIGWLTERLPSVDLPSVPWPDVDWLNFPDLSLPGWLLAVVATAKYWVPILLAVGLAVREARKRTSKHSASPGRAGPLRRARTGSADLGLSESGKGSPQDAHR